MTLYAGLDVGDKATHLCVVDGEGGRGLRHRPAPPRPARGYDSTHPRADGPSRLAGYHASWRNWSRA
jgi:hypothetical protein